MATKEQMEEFFQSAEYGVVGASSDREKYGNKVLRVYLQQGKRVIPVNPKEHVIEGVACVASVSELPPQVKSISVVTPPHVTEQVVELAIAKGVESIWMQPGAESHAAVEKCRKGGINVIADGSCILVVLGYREQ
jgi:predicted CoA-binding protein